MKLLLQYLLFYHRYYSKIEYEIVIVEDNSPDGTLQVAQSIQKIFGKDKIIILSRSGKLGLGSAYMVTFIIFLFSSLLFFSRFPTSKPKLTLIYLIFCYCSYLVFILLSPFFLSFILILRNSVNFNLFFFSLLSSAILLLRPVYFSSLLC